MEGGKVGRLATFSGFPFFHSSNLPLSETMSHTNIWPAQPRPTAQIKFSDGQVLEGILNSTIEDFIKAGNFPADPQPMACLVNGQLRELTYHADRDLMVRVLTVADSDGMRVYRRSLSLLLVAAADELFSEQKLILSMALILARFIVRSRVAALSPRQSLTSLKLGCMSWWKPTCPFIKSVFQSRKLKNCSKRGGPTTNYACSKRGVNPISPSTI